MKRKQIEKWVNVAGYIGRFQISNVGRVKSLKRKTKRVGGALHLKEEMIKKLRITNFGYVTVYLSIDKAYKHHFVHRLVACHFISPRPSIKHFVNHINGIKTDNRDVNLEWVTASENIKHAFRTGLKNQNGEKHPRAKLNDKKVLHIISSGISSRMLSQKYSVSIPTINRIKAGKSWSHIYTKRLKNEAETN